MTVMKGECRPGNRCPGHLDPAPGIDHYNPGDFGRCRNTDSQSFWFNTIPSWVLYLLGNLFSRVGPNTEWGWDLYQKLMRWSSNLDWEGKVWTPVGRS